MNTGRIIRISTIFLLLTLQISAQEVDTAIIANQAAVDSQTLEKIIEPGSLKVVQMDSKLFFRSDGSETGSLTIHINGEEEQFNFINGICPLKLEVGKAGQLKFISYQTRGQSQMELYHLSYNNDVYRIRIIPLWLSIIPPLIAILLALVFKEVIISLFLGIWAGAFIAGGLRIESIYFIFQSLFKSIERYIIDALVDSEHLSVIVFSLLIGGMVAVISKNGGMAGVVKSLSRFARGPRSAQFITWLLGVAIFFDDYANTLIVGNTMRSVTDRFRISREKLAYIVDSTAAPVSSIAFITTWIGAELGYIDDAFQAANIPIDMTPYGVFISSLKYSFYPILTLIFVLLVVYFRKDFGEMFKAEKRAVTTGQVSPALTEEEDEPNMEDLSPVKNAPLNWYNAAIPVLTVILMTIYGLLDTGMSALYHRIIESSNDLVIQNNWSDVWANIHLTMPAGDTSMMAKIGNIIGSADPFAALLWSSMSGVIIAILLTVMGKIMRLFDSIHWMVTGFKAMMPALIILTLAWALAITTDELHTADYLSSTLRHAINPFMFPVIIFALAAVIAFSTGSSWSTMAILYPIAIPTTYSICIANGMDMGVTMEILFNVIATVLAASVLGDHCSPISDTTILSSLASDCNHIDHVRTQLPYALTVGLVSITCVGLSTYFGGGVLICLVLILVSIAIFVLILKTFGKTIPDMD